MRALEHRLRLVSTGRSPASAPDLGSEGELGDVALTATLFAVFFLPIASALVHVGRWSPGELGLGAAGSVLAGRALFSAIRSALRARRRP